MAVPGADQRWWPGAKPTAFAEISPVADPYAGNILSTRVVVTGNILALLILPLLLCVVLIAFCGFYLITDKAKDDGWSPAIRACGPLGICIGALLVIDAEATFVQIVPRCNWGRVMLETATDVGFLKVDPYRREILFEGDRERYRVPEGAIIACSVEPIAYGVGTRSRITQYTTVLRAWVSSGEWERPIGQRGDFGRLGANKRHRLAEEMRAKMLSIVPPVVRLAAYGVGHARND
jgi:hypothetical protein